MIHSSVNGRLPMAYQTWIGFNNSFLTERGYPPHSALNVAEVQEGMIPQGLPAWAYTGHPNNMATAPGAPQPTNPNPSLEEMVMAGLKKPVKPKNINKIYNIPFWEAFKGKIGSHARQEGEIGLEIEAEGMNLFNMPISWWLTHPDGSLRPYKDHPPIEYVLRKPISREDVPKALSYLTKKLKEAGSQFVDSHRTSVHVHVNCQELTIKQIYQYWCLYTIFEEMLVEFSGPDRPGNLFCLSSKQAEYAVTCLEQAIQNENFNDVFSDNLRYTSCNTASLGKFGSLEFRSMRGTVDQNLIQVWVDILLILRDKALSYECPRSIVKDFTRLGPEAFLNKIFSDRPDIRAIFNSRTQAERNKSMWEGVRLMKDVAYAIVWDKQIIEEKKKEPPKEDLALPEYSGYGDFQPVTHIVDQVWLMSDGETKRVVNFGDNLVMIPYGIHPMCHFTPRRWWNINEEETDFLQGLHNHGIVPAQYYPPEL